MLNRFSHVGLLAAIVVIAGCATQTPIEFESETGAATIEQSDIPKMYINDRINPDYHAFLKKLFPGDMPSTVDSKRQHFLFRYCVALFELRDYGKTLACLDSVKKSVETHGDPPLIRNDGLFGSYLAETNTTGGEFPLAVREPMLRSELFLELGEIAESARSANLSMTRFQELKAKAPDRLKRMHLSDDLLPRTVCETRMITGACGHKLFGHIETLTHLAIVYFLNGDFAKAQDYIDDLSRRYASLPAVISKIYATRVRAALVRAYIARREPKRALALVDDEGHLLADLITLSLAAGSIAAGDVQGIYGFLTATFADQHVYATRFQVAHAKVEVGRHQDARLDLDDILGKDELKVLAGIYWAALFDRGRIAETEAKFDEAIKYYMKSIDEIERQRSTINTEGAKIGFFGDKQDVYRSLIRLLFQMQRYEEAFLIGERSKSRALVDMLANKRDFHVAPKDVTKIQQLMQRSQIGEITLSQTATLDSELEKRISQRSATTSSGEKLDVVAILDVVRNLKDEAQSELSTQAPELASLVSVAQIGLPDIQRALPANHVLVSYYFDNRDLYAFVISASNLLALKLNRDNLEQDVETFRLAIQKHDDTYMRTSKLLYARLIEPLTGHVAGKSLIVAGHGALHYLPFAALSNGREFLIDQHRLSSLPSATTLKFVRQSKAKAKVGTVLAFGNPDLGDPKYDLAFAEREAREIGKLFEESAVFVRKDASKSNLKEYGSSFRYLHFATHGKFDATHPLDSALFLSTNHITNINDRLTISELYSMRLDAELVTLSACETGLGRTANGDDVVGLVRGFMYAGAGQIVSTLWEVEDTATSVLMTDFYRRIKDGTDKVQALRESQLALRRNFPHPYFWAAFQITEGAKTN